MPNQTLTLIALLLLSVVLLQEKVDSVGDLLPVANTSGKETNEEVYVLGHHQTLRRADVGHARPDGVENGVGQYDGSSEEEAIAKHLRKNTVKYAKKKKRKKEKTREEIRQREDRMSENAGRKGVGKRNKETDRLTAQRDSTETA